MSEKQRNWQFTLNQVERYNELVKYLKSKKSLKYFISCKEISPQTKHEHIHIFAHFSNAFYPKINKCEGAHVEKCFGSIKQNIEYIKKLKNKNDYIIEEYGEVPKEKEKLTIKKVKEMSITERNNLPLVYFNIIQKINESENQEIDIDVYYKKVSVIYLWGESGIGKTKYASNIISDLKKKNEKYSHFNNVKFTNNFWIGVGNSFIALYDDFRDTHMPPSEFINFIDYAKHIMNVKYGSKQNNYEIIIITSIQSPESLYNSSFNYEEKEQWLRRLKIIHLTNDLINNLINVDELII